MNIGLLTTWNSKCGIADYSEYLVDSFTRAGHEVIVFCNQGAYKDIFCRYQYAATIVPGCFGVFWWGEKTYLDVDRIKDYIKTHDIDVLHIQYQSSLYEESLNDLIAEIDIPVYVTLHDSTLHPKHFPKGNRVTAFIHHKHGIAERFPNRWFIEYPYPMQTPRILSFGMGRNQVDIVKKVCEELGFIYHNHDARDSDEWLSQGELQNLIRKYDAVVLWYNDVPGMVGNSFAARTALSCHRPVYVNDIAWFNDLNDAYFIKIPNEEFLLKSHLKTDFDFDVMSFDKMSSMLTERYACDLLPKM